MLFVPPHHTVNQSKRGVIGMKCPCSDLTVDVVTGALQKSRVQSLTTSKLLVTTYASGHKVWVIVKGF